jgi:hypothetical protein
MGSAAILTFPTVLRENTSTLIVTLTSHVNVRTLMSGLILHMSEMATVISVLVLTPSMIAPVSLEINLNTNIVALVVHQLAVLVEAIISSTFFQQLFFCRIFQENIHKALDLLRGRPIDLAILLKALLVLIGGFKVRLAAPPTLVVIVFAIQIVTSIPLAILCLTLCLHAVANGILLNISTVSGTAFLVQFRPRVKRTPEFRCLVCDPRSKGSIHVQVCNLTAAKTTTIPGAVPKQATFLLEFGARHLVKVAHKVVQRPALCNVSFV